MKIPGFIIIGVVKGGSTTIASHLSLHPEICFSSIKEPGYFDTRKERDRTVRNHHIESIDQYLDLFENKSLLTGEGSVGYFTDKNAAKKIREQNQNCKLIVSIRNPVDRLFSQFLFFQQKGFEDKSIDFNEFTRCYLEEGRIITNRKTYFERSKYGKYIKYWLEVFPLEQFHFIKFEDLIRDQLSTINGTLKYLGVEPLKYLTEIQLAKSGIVKNPFKKRLTDFMTRNSDIARSVLPKTVTSNLQKRLLQVRNRNLIKPEIEVETKRRLEDYFRSDLLEFSKQTEIDVRDWL